MPSPSDRPLGPFGVAAGAIAILTLALFRLPQLYVAQLERRSLLSSAQAGWAYRLLVAAAVAQAAYGGFVFLTTERVRKALLSDEPLARLPRDRLLRSLARNSAFMCVLTVAYGIASFVVSGERGGYWLFFLIAVAQGAWYFRQVGEIGRWLALQPEPVAPDPRRHVWRREPPDYSPPLAREL